MTSAINCYRDEVTIYYSVYLYIIPYAEICHIVKNIFTQPVILMSKCRSRKVVYVDGGVFVIANVTSLSYGINPASCVLTKT